MDREEAKQLVRDYFNSPAGSIEGALWTDNELPQMYAELKHDDTNTTEKLEAFRKNPKDFDLWTACKYALEKHVLKNVPIPKEFGPLILDLMNEKIRPPKRGPRKKAFVSLTYYSAVKLLVDNGMTATRSDFYSHENSACDIVAEVACEFLGKQEPRKTIGYKTIKNNWLELKHLNYWNHPKK